MLIRFAISVRELVAVIVRVMPVRMGLRVSGWI
jgi:hypothetical protein